MVLRRAEQAELAQLVASGGAGMGEDPLPYVTPVADKITKVPQVAKNPMIGWAELRREPNTGLECHQQVEEPRNEIVGGVLQRLTVPVCDPNKCQAASGRGLGER